MLTWCSVSQEFTLLCGRLINVHLFFAQCGWCTVWLTSDRMKAGTTEKPASDVVAFAISSISIGRMRAQRGTMGIGCFCFCPASFVWNVHPRMEWSLFVLTTGLNDHICFDTSDIVVYQRKLCIYKTYLAGNASCSFCFEDICQMWLGWRWRRRIVTFWIFFFFFKSCLSS